MTELLGWPEAQANILGDWTTATRAEMSAGAATGSRKRQRVGTRKQWYAPNATRAQQVRARGRYVAALSAGLRRLDAIGEHTTWEDVFPSPPPPELAAFYGEQQ